MTLLIIIILLALVFDYLNGFHDAANSITNVVSTKVLTPFLAVLWAAFFNFVAFFVAKHVIGGFGIANTVASTVHSEYITLPIILAGLITAILWNLFTWWKGIPSSSSHTLIGGFAGAAIAGAGFQSIYAAVIIKIAAFILLAPFIGMIMAAIITIIIMHICKRAQPHKAEYWFKRLQLVSAGMFSLGHGLNDSQKTMGIIAVTLIAFNGMPDVAAQLPHWMQLTSFDLLESSEKFDWIPLACFVAIALGTMSGGWRIVKTMGTRITKIKPLEGVAADTAGALTLYLTEWLKVPVSTTHVIAGAIMGVGAVKRVSAVRWGVTINLMWAWIITIPVSALLAMGIYHLLVLCGLS